MNKILITVILISITANINKIMAQKLEYPATKEIVWEEDHYGFLVGDPYHWLENDTSAETTEWVQAENKVTNEYLGGISFRDKIKKRMTKLWNFKKSTAPFKAGPNYLYYRNDGIQNQNVLYVRPVNNSKAERILLDPNKLWSKGTTSLSTISASNDGKYLGYGISVGGSDWEEYHVMNIETGDSLPDVIKWVKFSGMAWYGNGFYYSRYDEPQKGHELSQKNENQKVYYHKLGTKQSDDRLFYENPKYPLRSYTVQVTQDEHFLLLYETESTSGNALYVKDLKKADAKLIPVIEGFESDNNVIDNIGNKLVLLTNNNAPRYRMVFVNPDAPSVDKWEYLIQENNDVIEGATVAWDKIVVKYMKDASSRLYIYDSIGANQKEIPLATFCTVDAINGNQKDSLLFYSYASFTVPTTVMKYNILTGVSTVVEKPDMDFNADNYETKEIFYTSKDGTKVPMFIVHKKGLKMNGNNPTYLYGYGGFNISITPQFKTERLVFLERGGVLAVACIRGGGEYGEDWHHAGIKWSKQNVFDDFIAAAQYLISEKYTNSDKLAIGGRSNGGLLIGAAITQHPELFKVAIPSVGVMDMLRYHKFTIGYAWASDYGTCEESQEMFMNLLKYSPLHNIKDSVAYPATLITTGDHDDRVVPAHSFKFAATMQAKSIGDNPILIRIDGMAGHGSGKPTAKLIDEYTDIWSFIFYNLGMKME
jgi:prolyl oligopeptidase